MRILDILNELEQDGSRLAKLSILRREKDNRLLQKVLKLALDPMIQFYQRKIPEYKLNSESGISLSLMLNGLSVLSNREKTGNAAIEYLRELLSLSDSHDDAKVLERIIQKDLRCGVAEGTVNKIWPGLISSFPVMLCAQSDEKTISKMEWPALAQIKMDGARINAIVRNGQVEYRSRNGKPLEFFGVLDEFFIAMANGEEFVFDGELLVVDGGVVNRQTGNGIISKANKGTITEAEAKKLNAVVWDIIPYELFTQGHDLTPYIDRWEDLVRRHSKTYPKKIKLVESVVVDTLAEAQSYFQKALDNGEEGIILKNVDGVWEDKRSKNCIKFKAELTADLVVVGVQEGNGKYEGKIGALLCESSDGKLKVSVGSGLVDSERVLPYETYLNRIIEVKYNAKISNMSGENSLFLPIFLKIRDDKTVANSFEEIE